MTQTFRLPRLLLACAALLPLSLPALADNYPAKPIRFIVPYAPGGTTDLVARTVGQKMSDKLGKPVVIENRPGAGGNIGMDAVAKSPADGYTVGMGAISTNALNAHIYQSMPFDPRRDFTPVGMLGYSTIVLQVSPQLQINTVAQLLDYAKKQPTLNYGTAGVGTSMHLAGVLFAQTTGANLTHVAYKGSAPAINDMLGGHLQVMFENLPASLPHIQAGRIKALAVAGRNRAPALPNVPTMAEAGLAGYAVEPWFAVYGPAGMPAAVVSTLNQALNEALALPDVRDKLLQAGFSPKTSSPQELHQLGQQEYERFGKVAKAAGMKAD
jgi:tripartite-type tricarboxylate transporter receptor subunit TctC